MLFDLHQVAQDRHEFDALSMLFTVKFEQSPPAWSDSGDSPSDPRRAQSRERKDFFTFKPTPDGDITSEIDRLATFAESQGTVRIDVAKVTSITAEDALLMASALVKLRKKHVPMWFNNLEGLERVLRSAFNERSLEEQKSYWLLLFELLILQGKVEEFEELGLEFAVAFEMSPPNWEAYVNSVSEAVKGAAAAATAASAAEAIAAREPEAGFLLKGVLSTASSNQIAEFNAYASTRPEVVVDMGKVMRIDFAFTATFFDAVKATQLAGKRVILAGLNELNAALLEALGVNRYAILVRRKST
jgi:anti-anti-sigma regulatory factor